MSLALPKYLCQNFKDDDEKKQIINDITKYLIRYPDKFKEYYEKLKAKIMNI